MKAAIADGRAAKGGDAMTMTELIGSLERSGWRFRLDEDHVRVRPPKSRPAGADDIVVELGRRQFEAAGFLRARDEAFGTMLTFHLPSLPVFADTPPPEGRVVPFPSAPEPASAAAASSRHV